MQSKESEHVKYEFRKGQKVTTSDIAELCILGGGYWWKAVYQGTAIEHVEILEDIEISVRVWRPKRAKPIELSANLQRVDRPWDDYPIGTIAYTPELKRWTKSDNGWVGRDNSIIHSPPDSACFVSGRREVPNII